jgi:hypothetical protein
MPNFLSRLIDTASSGTPVDFHLILIASTHVSKRCRIDWSPPEILVVEVVQLCSASRSAWDPCSSAWASPVDNPPVLTTTCFSGKGLIIIATRRTLL